MSLRAVSVRVTNPNPVRIGSVTYDSVVNVKVNNQQDYKVKSASLVTNKLSGLSDVSAQNPQDGDVLIYNAETKKYETDKIGSDQIDLTNIDAGLF
jgi:hypothetical protein